MHIILDVFFYLILITVCICRIRKAKPIISHTYILNQKGLGKLSEFNWICQQNCCKLSSLIFCLDYFTSKLWKFPPQKMQIIKIWKPVKLISRVFLAWTFYIFWPTMKNCWQRDVHQDKISMHTWILILRILKGVWSWLSI